MLGKARPYCNRSHVRKRLTLPRNSLWPERLLTSHRVHDRHLARDINCIDFIARKLIKLLARGYLMNGMAFQTQPESGRRARFSVLPWASAHGETAN
jgi:hypothetical protein